MMKMSKSRISSNDKRVIWESTQIDYWNDKTLLKDSDSEVNEWLINVLRYEGKMLSL
jgi:hypothetical protein